MLFRKDIDPHCSYCKFAAGVEPGTVICKKKGIMPESGRCARFRYDPLQRVPPRPIQPDFTKYDDRDFSL
jgi:hypothetical protein